MMAAAAFKQLGRSRVIARFTLSAFGAIGLQAGCTRAAAGDTIVFGLAAPMQDVYGESTRLGAELAQREINARGGQRLESAARDDGRDPARAKVVADSLVADPRVVAVVGHINSSTMLTAGPHYDQRELVALATSATSPNISELGPYVFLERVGADRQRIRDYLDGIGERDGEAAFAGVAGPLAFDDHGDPVNKPFVIFAIDRGGFQLLAGNGR